MANPPIAVDRISPSSGSHANGKPGKGTAASTRHNESEDDNQAIEAFNIRRYRPMGVSDMFDEAFDLYKNNFKLLLISTAIVYVPLYAALIIFFNPLMTQLIQLGSNASPDFERMLDIASKTMVDTTLASLVSGFAMIIVTGAVGYIVGQLYLRRKVTIGESYLLAGRRAAVLCFSVILAGLFSSLWLVGCGILVLVPSVRFSILPQVVMLEKQGILSAVKRCWKMTSTAAWRLGTVLTMLFIVDIVMRDALSEPVTIVHDYLAQHLFPAMAAWTLSESMIATNIISCLVGLLLQPLGIAVMTIAYYDIRIRDEGFDMAIINERLGHGTSDAIGELPASMTKRAAATVKRR